MTFDAPLIIWVNSPPFVERGGLLYLESHWPGGVTYAVLGPLRDERIKMGWADDYAIGDATFIERGDRSIDEFCRDVLREAPGALHLVAGLSSVTGRALARIVRTEPPERVAVFTERPGAYGPFSKRILSRLMLPFKYRWLVRRYRQRVGLLLPLGRAGIDIFVRYGWPPSRVAPYMYCPVPREQQYVEQHGWAGPVRFLYVGRLSRFTKGTDVLLKAAELVRGDWSLTLVGGHGDLVVRTKSWAREHGNVRLAGAASPDEVSAEMLAHDVVVVPSRFDGWNVVINEATYAARGAIVTDQAVSHELIEAGGAGLVVRAASVTELANAMQRVVDQPRLAETWSERARNYNANIQPQVVGGYVFELLMALVHGTQPAAVRVPWLSGATASAKRAQP